MILENNSISGNVLFVSGWVFSKKDEIYQINILSPKKKILYSINNFVIRNDVIANLNLDQNVYGFNCYVKIDSNYNYLQFVYENNTQSEIYRLRHKNSPFKLNNNIFIKFITFFYKLFILTRYAFRYLIGNKFTLQGSYSSYFIKSLNYWNSIELNYWNSIEYLDKSSFINNEEKKLNVIKKFQINEILRNKILEDIKNFNHKIKISIVVPVYNVPIEYLDALMNSFVSQIFKNIEIIYVDNKSNKSVVQRLKEFEKKYNFVVLIMLSKNHGISEATNIGIAHSSGDFIGFVDHDDLLTEDAIYLIAKKIIKNKNVKWVYTDEAKIDERGNVFSFQCKPDFSPAMLMSTNYIQHLNVVRSDILKKISLNSKYDGAQDYDLNLKLLSEIDERSIYHINKVCYLWRAHDQSTAKKSSQKKYIYDSAFRCLNDFLKKSNLNAYPVLNTNAEKNGNVIFNIKWEMSETGPVTIIIPNRDSPNLLNKCLESITRTCDIKKIKIIIVDDNSKNKETFRVYSKFKKNNFLSFVVLNYKRDIDEFNYSKLINYAVNYVDTKFFIQLNNDIEALSKNWIDQMLGWFSMKNVKIVGVNLYYPDLKIQHSGVHIGPNGGLADHLFRGYKDTYPNYFGYLWCSRNVSAVTAACMMIETSFFKKLRGFDERSFKVQFNDVDFCLRTVNEGKKIVIDPSVKLIHHESISRGKKYDYSEHINFINKYENFNDVFYSPNLMIDSNDFSINYETNYYFDHFSKHKVLILVHELTRTGAPIVALNLAKYLVKKGYEVTIFSPKVGPLKKLVLSNNINLMIHNPSKNMKSFINNFIRNNEFEIIISNSLFSPWHLIDNNKSIRAKLLNIHESISLENYFSNFLSRENFSLIEIKRKINSFDSLIFQSKSSMQIFNDDTLFEKGRLIPGSLPYDEISSYRLKNNKTKLRAKYGLSSKDFLILNLGTVCERKGQEIFIKAAVKFIHTENYSKDVKFLIVGDNDSYYSKYIKKLIPPNCKKYFYFFDESDSFFDFYELSDLFVCTSFQESFPMVLLYAMAFELPIISSNVNGILEMLSIESSLLINPGDVNKLCSCLIKMIEDDNFRTTLKINAKSKFLRYYDESKTMPLYQDLVESIVFYK